jgi:hypothetical protein
VPLACLIFAVCGYLVLHIGSRQSQREPVCATASASVPRPRTASSGLQDELHDPRDGRKAERRLHTSPEFAMEKLLVAGMARIPLQQGKIPVFRPETLRYSNRISTTCEF